MAYDPFVPSEGNEFEGPAVVQDSWFEYDEDNDRVVLKLQLYSEDPDVGEEIKQYGCGGGWEVKDDGARIVHESGKNKKFHVKSGVGTLLKSCNKTADQSRSCCTLLKSCNKNGIDLRSRGYSPFEAALWKGLDAEWEMVSDEFEIDGDTITRSIPVPVSVNGNGTKAPAASTPAPAPASNLSADLTDKLVALAKECDSHDAFMERAFTEVEGVAGNQDAELAVTEASGIYAQARG